VTSDRWWAYNHLPVRRRQVCWSHLRRDFEFLAEGRGSDKDLGHAGLSVCKELLWAWEIYTHTGDRRELTRRVRAAANANSKPSYANTPPSTPATARPGC